MFNASQSGNVHILWDDTTVCIAGADRAGVAAAAIAVIITAVGAIVAGI